MINRNKTRKIKHFTYNRHHFCNFALLTLTQADMELIERLFPRYDSRGKELIYNAYRIAEDALKEQTRSNGHPFIEHPLAVAQIACDEIGLSAECVAAVFLQQAICFAQFAHMVNAHIFKYLLVG